MQIADRAFLVTGGSSGLGAACVVEIVRRGGRVLVADLRQPGAAWPTEVKGKVQFCETDVTDRASVQVAIDCALSAFGPLRGSINCAGILGAARVVGRDGPHDLDLFRRVVEVNLIGTFNVLTLAATALSSQPCEDGDERGVIVNTSSVAAFDGQIGQAAYSASKGGVASLTLPAARELARFGIRVVAIAPGAFETPMVGALPAEAQEALAAQVPFPKRLGRPEEFARLVCHVIENQMLNGTVVRLDGALRMSAK
jgi:NAD(P)-dependent dehydrogenase (short-subunit alcohol dehydrogenase family)